MLHHFMILASCLPLMLADSTALGILGQSSKLFSVSVYKQVAGIEKGNFLFSPLSAETVLALVQSGANGTTGEEIRTALHLPNYQTETEAAFKAFKEDSSKKDVYVLNSANKVYVQKGLAVKDDFNKTATEVFGSQVENIDFSQNQQTADTINKWIEGRTGNKIKGLIKADDLAVDTRVVLVNALHFKGNWSQGFTSIGNRDFFLDHQTIIKVPTMDTTDKYLYYKNEKLHVKFLEVPFEGDDVTLTIVLPNQKISLPDLEERLEEVFQTPNYTRERMHFRLPKFTSETELDFKEILQKLGVKQVFTPDADLGGFMAAGDHIHVEKVLQKSFIAVDEKGVEAAAATQGQVNAHTALDEFNVDHPFIYYIKFKNVIIFVGRVVDPTK